MRSRTRRGKPRPAGGAEVAPAPAPDPAAVAAAQAAEAASAARIAAYVDALRARPEPPLVAPGRVTEALAARVPAEAAAAVEARLDGSARDLWDQTPAEHRHVLMLVFAAFYDVPEVLEAAGLVRALPPEDVHAMARGILAYAGDPLLADLVADTFAEAGLAIPERGTLLDFGCSSGRILRVLAAYRPGVDAVGCDPNDGAIAWASEHLPMARFFASPTSPPLELGDASVDRAYAISIWSHFAAEAGQEWLAEMHRVIRPGGALLLTTHGFDTIGVQLRADLMTEDSAAEAAETMLREGLKYFDVFGEAGDWGVKDPGWGNSYTSVDWFLARVTPQWSVRLFRPAHLSQNQDVFVLERMP